MSPSILLIISLTWLTLLTGAGLAVLLYIWRQPPRANPLTDVVTQLSADHVASTERVLAAFTDQAKNSNEHLSGLFAQPQMVGGDIEHDLPVTISRAMETEPDYSDPTDWGDLAPTRSEVVMGTDTGLPDFQWDVEGAQS